MTNFLIWMILVYGLLVAIGGIFGYVRARSKPSLISGLLSGALLAIAWAIGLQTSSLGLGAATLIAIGLLVVFTLRFRKTQKFMPAGLLAILSLVAAVGFAIGWFNLGRS